MTKAMEIIWKMSTALIVIVSLSACSDESDPPAVQLSADSMTDMNTGKPNAERPDPGRLNPDRNAYFGDLHVHTSYSFDAFAFGTLATPHDAYRYATGEAIRHPGGFDVQLDSPLDFYAVTDHAMFLGVARDGADTSTELSKAGFMEAIHNLNASDNMGRDSIPQRMKAFRPFIAALGKAFTDDEIDPKLIRQTMQSAWTDTIKAADDFYKPGMFTTFAAYEYTISGRNLGSLHRNVIFRDTDDLPSLPFSRLNSANPEDLWSWMDTQRQEGVESLAIPHNANGSGGQMFELMNWAGEPMDAAYTEQRLRNEPLVEITQVKGTSETHPALSMNDEWADFEIAEYSGSAFGVSKQKGSYVRDALKNGLALEVEGVGNPFKFGFIGSSDTHTGAGSYDETQYFSKVGVLDARSDLRGSIPFDIENPPFELTDTTTYTDPAGRIYYKGKQPTWGASGLAVVWAEENTRESIYDAFRRKETFATSGPRMRVRFFAGADLTADMLETSDGISRAYAAGVPMGSTLLANTKSLAPAFLVWAMRDAQSAPLQRVQIIKGWMEGGETIEQVIDIACADGLIPDPVTHRCADNGAKVDATTCAFSADVGAAELKTLWRDPDFDAKEHAFYYVRVLENPTCRWSTWDALRASVEPRPDLARTIQERSWSSPIWFKPGSE
jgi:hypothetical protein